MRAETRVNAEQAPKTSLRKPTLRKKGEGRRLAGKRATRALAGLRRGSGVGTCGRWEAATGTPRGAGRADRVADGPVARSTGDAG